MYACVLVEYPIKTLDKTFTYIIPDNLKNKLKKGMKVLVPFNNKLINGFVLDVINNYEADYELKEIDKILDEELVLSDELLSLGSYMHDTLLCPTISAYQVMLPPAFKAKNQKNNYNLIVDYVVLNKDDDVIEKYINDNDRYVKQIDILNKLLNEKKVLKSKVSGSSLNTLLKKELVRIESEEQYRINVEAKDYVKNTLTKEQESVYKSIDLDKHDTYLLYGVTGSGKTEVYLNLIEDVVRNGKSAIMLVPEISISMQIANRFYERFGNNVAVLHSALSQGEKHDEYLKIFRGEVSVVVGTRSAIFAPFKNLGIIIMDEENSDSYKQDATPRYHAKDVALFRAKYHNIPLVLGSATPTLEAMARAKKGVYKLLSLPNRVGKSVLPEVKLVSMEEEYKKHNFIFSDELKKEINNCLDNGEQAIILLNRRGFSTFISCSSCGYTYKCPNCDISLTYHKGTNNLICHYCGNQIKCDEYCPKCGEDGLKYMGMGTEKLEEEIIKNFKNAKVVRMDLDSTNRKGAHDKIINDFKEGKYNILLGTSMISKGLDFPNVTLVGVINADTSLNIPDYKSNENTYALLSQVAGRAGRREKQGKVIIQTFNPDNKVLNLVKENSYDKFYEYEMNFRRILKYPPYYYLIGIKITSKDYNKALTNSKKVMNYLKQNVDKTTICLGPTTAQIFRFNNTYRFQIIIKYRFDNKLLNVLKDIDEMLLSVSNVSMEVDINPTRI